MTRFAAWFAAGLVALWVGPGCTSSENAVCAAKCDCTSCSGSEFQACMDRLAADKRSADRRGCTDQYDDLLSCEDDTARCSGPHLQTACGPERDRYDQCAGTDSATCINDLDCPHSGHPFCSNGKCVECHAATDCESGKNCVEDQCK